MANLPRKPSYCVPIQMVFFAIALALILLPGGSRIPLQAICTLLLLHTVWAFWSWHRVSGTLFDPYALFLLSATLFNAGLALLEVFGINSEPMLSGFPPHVVLRSQLLVLGGLVGLHFGALVAFSPRRDMEIHTSPTSRAAMRITGLVILAASFVPLLGQIRHLVSVAGSGGYLALYQYEYPKAGTTSTLAIAADFILPGACFLLAGSARRPFYRVVGLAVLVPYCFTLLLVGHRGHSVLPLIGVAWLWDRTIQRIPRLPVAIIGAVLLLVVFPLVRDTREVPDSERGSDTSAHSEAVTVSSLSTLAEMGFSVVTVAHTVELVPAHRPYDLGVGFGYALFTIVPSLFWDRHPSQVEGRIPSFWLVETVEPVTAKRGATLGYSFIADAYLNFGPLGVPLIAFLMGWGLVLFYLWAGPSPARLAIVATFLQHLLFVARSEFAILPRPFVWYGLSTYALYLFVLRQLEKRSSTRPDGCALAPSGHER